jgi:hypothetical protein
LPRLSKATVEGIFVGVIKNLDALEAMPAADVRQRYQNLRQHAEFSIDSLKEGLSDATKVASRLNAAIGIFGAN